MPSDTHGPERPLPGRPRTESDLRDALRGRAHAPAPIDPDAVLRRARARRLPRQVAAGAVATLAVVSVVALGATTLPYLLPRTSGALQAADSGGEPGPAEQPETTAGGTFQYPPQGESFANGCGEPVKPSPPSMEGLELTLAFPASAPADGLEVHGVATLTNTGSVRLIGSTSAQPVVTIARDGITVWHTKGPDDLAFRSVDLAPGESLDYAVSLTPVECTAVDELGESFREGLPALAPGTYEVSAFLAFAPEGAGLNSIDLVGAAAGTIVLH